MDTAHMYETETDVGAAIRGSGVPRKEIFVTTKIPGPIGNESVQKMILQETLPKSFICKMMVRYGEISLAIMTQIDTMLGPVFFPQQGWDWSTWIWSSSTTHARQPEQLPCFIWGMAGIYC